MPGMLKSTGSQRVRHNLVTELYIAHMYEMQLIAHLCEFVCGVSLF